MMLKRRKGFVSYTTLAVIFGLAAIIIGAAYAANEIQGLLTFMIKNFWTLTGFILMVGVVGAAVRNFGQEDPKWGQDLASLGALLLLVFGFVVIAPIVTGSVQTYTCQGTVTMKNVAGQEPSIEAAEVSDCQGGAVLQSLSAQTFGIFKDEVQGEYSVICDGEAVDTGSFSDSIIDLAGEISTVDKNVKLLHIPSGGDCLWNIRLYHDGDLVDRKQVPFTGPS